MTAVLDIDHPFAAVLGPRRGTSLPRYPWGPGRFAVDSSVVEELVAAYAKRRQQASGAPLMRYWKTTLDIPTETDRLVPRANVVAPALYGGPERLVVRALPDAHTDMLNIAIFTTDEDRLAVGGSLAFEPVSVERLRGEPAAGDAVLSHVTLAANLAVIANRLLDQPKP